MPADARRGALERLDRRWVVVALDLEGDGEAVAEVEHARVLARALQDARPVAGEPSQQERGVLVPAVLRPEQREDGELEVVRLALEQRDDTVELLVREAELAVERRVPRRSSEGQSTGGYGGARAGRQRGSPRPRRLRSHDVSRRDALLLLLLSAIWGSSFMFIRLGVDELEPSVVVLGRTVVGALVLLPLVIGRGGLRPIRACARAPRRARRAQQRASVLAARLGETHLDSGLTAVIQAAAPIFTVLLACGWTPASA